MKHQHTTAQSLEYIALLSGLSMAGSEISDKDIKNARKNHSGNKKDRTFNFASLLSVPKH